MDRLECRLEEKIANDTCQQISIKVKHKGYQRIFIISAMYARCSVLKRLKLWENLEDVIKGLTLPCIVGGNSNVILKELKKLGRLPVTYFEMMNFVQCINSSNLSKITFTDSAYTW